MPDITTSNWFPVLTLLLGYATKSLSDWLEHRRNTRREREAREALRRDKLFEQRTGFQRQTLLDLQEASIQLARSMGAITHQDKMAYRSTGKWGKQLLADDLSEGSRLAQARTGMLAARVRDNTIRELTDKLKARSTEAVNSRTPEDSERAYIDVNDIYAELNQRIVEVLRKLDDAEQIDFHNAGYPAFLCSSNVQMSVPSNLKMSVSAAVWWAVGGDVGGGAKRERWGSATSRGVAGCRSWRTACEGGSAAFGAQRAPAVVIGGVSA